MLVYGTGSDLRAETEADPRNETGRALGVRRPVAFAETGSQFMVRFAGSLVFADFGGNEGLLDAAAWIQVKGADRHFVGDAV